MLPRLTRPWRTSSPRQPTPWNDLSRLDRYARPSSLMMAAGIAQESPARSTERREHPSMALPCTMSSSSTLAINPLLISTLEPRNYQHICLHMNRKHSADTWPMLQFLARIKLQVTKPTHTLRNKVSTSPTTPSLSNKRPPPKATSSVWSSSSPKKKTSAAA